MKTHIRNDWKKVVSNDAASHHSIDRELGLPEKDAARDVLEEAERVARFRYTVRPDRGASKSHKDPRSELRGSELRFKQTLPHERNRAHPACIGVAQSSRVDHTARE